MCTAKPSTPTIPRAASFARQRLGRYDYYDDDDDDYYYYYHY